jgi:hypothetical protein
MSINKLTLAIISGIIIATLSAAGKSYIDVERLKVNQLNLFDLVKETREDVKYIRRHFTKEKK